MSGRATPVRHTSSSLRLKGAYASAVITPETKRRAQVTTSEHAIAGGWTGDLREVLDALGLAGTLEAEPVIDSVGRGPTTGRPTGAGS